jgi:hypothetical protein
MADDKPLTMEDVLRRLFNSYPEHVFRKIMRCHTLADREEQTARVRAIIDLSIELGRIKAIDVFSTRLASSAIEHIIDGDWSAAEGYTEMFTFEEESEELRARYAPLWADFVLKLKTECQLARARARGEEGRN